MDGYAPTHEELVAVTMALALYPKFKEPLLMVKIARYQFNKTRV